MSSNIYIYIYISVDMPPESSCCHSCFSTFFYRKNSTKWGLRVRTRVSRHFLSKKLDQIENYSKRSIGFEDVPKRIEFYEQTLLDFYQPSAANPWILDRGFEGVLGHAQNRLPGSISLKNSTNWTSWSKKHARMLPEGSPDALTAKVAKT